MANLFEKPSPGDKFKPNAALQTILIDMVNWWIARQTQPGIETLRGPEITIRNMEEDGLNQYSVIRLGDIVFDPALSETGFRNDLVFDAAAPAADEIFLITQEPIAPDGGVGEARISGFSRVKVDFSNAGHKFAAPEDDNYDNLVSQASDGPAAIIWKESGTGTKWAVVSLNVSSTPGLGATTVVCVKDCRGSEYCLTVPRAWLAPNTGECEGDDDEPGGGTSDPCAECEEPLNQLCVVFPGVDDLFPLIYTGCSQIAVPVPITLAAFDEPPSCIWGSQEFIITDPSVLGNKVYAVSLHPTTLGWVMYFSDINASYTEAYYTFEGDWDCRSPMTMTRQSGSSGTYCQGFPDTVMVQPCGVGIPPTIAFNSADLCDDAATHVVYGTGFSSTAANNLLTLNSGTATCTGVTGTTSMEITFGTPPSTGALAITLTNENGSSTPPIQVANVVTCGGTLLADSYTEGAPPVLLTSHTGETMPFAYVNFDGQMACNSSGKAANSSADDDFGFIIDTGATTYEASIKFLIPPVAQDAGVRTFRAYARFLDANNCYFAEVVFSAAATTAPSFGVYQRALGVDTLKATGSVSLNQDTEYTCGISNTPTLINFTINAVSAGDSSTTFNGHSKIAIKFHSQFSSSTKPSCDDLLVEN